MPRTLPVLTPRSDHRDRRDGQHHPARVRPPAGRTHRRPLSPSAGDDMPGAPGQHRWEQRDVTLKETAMVDGDDAQPAPPAILAGSWQTAIFLGAVTVILGLIVTLHPTGSVNVIAVLLGILMILSGIFHLIRVFDPAESHRVWLGIAGLLFIVIGVVLIRHLHLTRAIIAQTTATTWIAQGRAALTGGISAGVREGR